jgi:Double zinc ribbon
LTRVARPSLLARFRRTNERGPEGARETGPRRRSLPHPGQLRKERRALLRAREERLRDLGGLMLEMFRRDQFRQDLIVERCDELLALDERLQELDTLLAAAVSVRRAAPAARCTCGAPLVWGSHFCANCGRPVAATPPVVGCRRCGRALPAEAKFCAVCGQAVSDQPAVGPGAEEPSELLGAFPASRQDPWEQ